MKTDQSAPCSLIEMIKQGFRHDVDILHFDLAEAMELEPIASTKRLVSADQEDVSSLHPLGLRPYDVVGGRGKVSQLHKGNKKFRRLVEEYAPAYQSTKFREEKRRITKAIIQTVHDLGGRFLKVDDIDLLNGVENYGEGSPEYEYEKVSHALRSFCKTSRRRKGFKMIIASESCDSSVQSAASLVDEYDDTQCKLQEAVKCHAEPHLIPTLADEDLEPLSEYEELNLDDIDFPLLLRL